MTPPDQPASDVLEIRRYSNRRFYDPSRSTHVTLEEIRNLVREGRDVRITEAKTGEDITSRVLTQIVLEYEAGKVAVLPADILHRLIRSSESVWGEMIARYVQNTSRFLEDSQRAASEQWQRVEGIAGMPKEVAQWWQGALGALPPAWRPPAPTPAPTQAPAPAESPDPEPDPAPQQEEDLRRVIDGLREQLDGVQADLQALRKAPAARPEDGSSGPEQG